MTIIISREGAGAVRVSKKKIEQEDFLQKYIYENPESLPLDEVKDGVQPLIVVREFPTGSGPIDLLVIDRDGELFLVETKLYKNPDKRLVVAQILDYAASLRHTYPTLDQFLAALDAVLQKSKGVDTQKLLSENLQLSEGEIEGLLTNLELNLVKSRSRFVVLMDTLEERLKNLILFLNEYSDFNIYAVELEHYEHDGSTIVRPTLFGAEGRKASTSRRETQRWDDKSFFVDAEKKLAPHHFTAVERIYEACKDAGAEITWGSGKTYGSFNPKFDGISRRSPFTVTSSGGLWLNFLWLNDTEAARAARDELKARVEKIVGFEISDDFRERSIQFLPAVWCPEVEQLIRAINDVVSGAADSSLREES